MNKTNAIATMNYQIENGTCLIPEGTKAIEKGAFINCTELTSVVIPDSVTEIGQWAFYGCSNLKEIRLPKSVTKIGLDAFAFCSSITSIEVDDDNKVFDSRDNCNAVICKDTNTRMSGAIS
ncbi:MAG: leucine-rich repeat domain-containing protein [Bacteroidales bacterium]|nr:leucine-rich repeat domain-containing protein [Bacteroidales bacterium]